MVKNKSIRTSREKLGPSAFVIGGTSFIPLIGVVFGIIAVIWGLITKKDGGRLLASIGAAGIAFTIMLYSSLYYFGFVQHGGGFDKLRQDITVSNLSSLVHAVEFYKLQYGAYPESLEILRATLLKDITVSIYDGTEDVSSGTSRKLYYQVLNNHQYYLLGVGLDGKPFTDDDIHPSIEIELGSRAGYRHRRMSTSQPKSYKRRTDSTVYQSKAPVEAAPKSAAK